jgi:glutamate synthase (NADPH/NADH) small chain
MGRGSTRSNGGLPADRPELLMADYKPLYTPAEAVLEAERCLYCSDAPCIQACPTGIDIPVFIKRIAQGNLRGAAHAILDANILGYSCARVCPVEVLCVGACVYNPWKRPPIQIGKLQRYAVEAVWDRAGTLFERHPPNGKRVALVGAGPASLAAGARLALAGCEAVLFEKRPVAGGLNTTGVAPYKMHAHDALREVELVESLGVEIRTGVEVGKDIPHEALLAGYDAVFLGVGLGADGMLGVPGENGPGVVGATAWIERMKNTPAALDGAPRSALVVGGGNTAMDVLQELRELEVGSVTLVYRRGSEAMSGYPHEFDRARRLGARALFDRVPLEVLRDADGVTGLRVAEAKGGKAVPGTEEILPADLIVLAVGQAKFKDWVTRFPGVEVDARGRVAADPETGRTANPKVYAGGDCRNGGMEVVNAVAEGKRAAEAMLADLLEGEP